MSQRGLTYGGSRMDFIIIHSSVFFITEYKGPELN